MEYFNLIMSNKFRIFVKQLKTHCIQSSLSGHQPSNCHGGKIDTTHCGKNQTTLDTPTNWRKI